MELHESLFAIGAMIVVAKLVEGIFKRFGLNSIIAYVATTDVILGPVDRHWSRREPKKSRLS